jgi:hypothetical protein
MAFKITDPQMSGLLPIGNIDTGTLPPNGATAGVTAPMFPGMIVQGSDPVFGAGEFILLAGVANTLVGSVVSFNLATFVTALCAATVATPVHIAVAMSANTSATNWAWYQISGVATAVKVNAAAVTAGKPVGIQTAGKINSSKTGLEVDGSSAVSVVAGTTSAPLLTGTVMLNRSHKQGRVS